MWSRKQARKAAVIVGCALWGGLASGLARGQTPDNLAKMRAQGEKIVMGSCFVCHGVQGESSSELYPKLAGQHAEYIAKQLENFQSGKRQGSTMGGMAASLSAQDRLAVGHYFEAQVLTPESAQKSQLLARGQALYTQGDAQRELSACATCHGQKALGTELLPRLAGQFAHYTRYQLQQFKSGARTNDQGVMRHVAQKLSAEDIEALAEYLSAQ